MSPDARALCQGEPLRTIEKRNQAMEDGYELNRRYDCITKASYAEVAHQKAVWQAGHTPEAVAAREREFAAQKAAAVAEHARQLAQAQRERDAPVTVDVSAVEANSATESALASKVGIGPELAARIVAARLQRPFRDWADLTGRVVGLGAAQTAVFASLCGLVVEGKSLEGMPPNADMAAALYKLYRR